ncbi:alpha-D-ribose 1-methylphosphonate 5-triphosphate diphosphatase [Phaeobacter gallaeciensis]|uniref:Alpha-D-ribose 1-methylphosphonate 5-triphosphate diphosphatase n=2 Tax=Roseobacteraceae TaxID=2854170 RepID=A0A366X8C4_9RHOB|nr:MULTISPECIES: alpha-D-ribose 1-methylphosphonate 5-triphosphate diphosphatase [Roseobacteraceae]MBT3139612.1 alpha-D-ribose 1-methylphosphonate 5-triphosphate diphosphatase [Falsiruegeria litorea]MBT8169970.1 alpha-D-ribose 1-methylphosphonate 5-triphosphate diphosphatase [Falsiruegeria litorea]RBW58537.1 alpha-D-ribose 1-methylphosphonate 5-triphosphate diphosphatase [Phaeobacter gallaeciensis]
MTALDLTLVGAQVLTETDGLRSTDLSIAGGYVVDARAAKVVDLSGFFVLPGIVDLHGDGFERHLAPRRGAMKQMNEGVLAAEAELAANGITTAVMAQFHSWEGGLRAPEYAAQVFKAIQTVQGDVVTDLIPQLRFETHMLDDYAGLVERIRDWGVQYLVFNDHLPHAKLAAGKKPPRLTGQALKAGRNPEKHLEMMQEMHRRSPEVPQALDQLCAALAEEGVLMGSHDDQSAEGRAIWRARGVRLSEFPETIEAAEAARSGGDPIVLGAPNVVRGGSHNGNVSAAELIAMGLCDALASDYHYPSPRRAALMLAKTGVLDFSDAWALVSSGPAAVLGLMDRGTLKVGARADLVVLEQGTHRVAGAFSGGRISYLNGDLAARLIG